MKTIAGGRRFHGHEPLKTCAMQRNATRTLQKILENAEISPSSSSNQRLNAARAGIERGGNTAPGSQIALTANGLLAGTRDEASTWLHNLDETDKSLFNAVRSRSQNPERFNVLSAEEKEKSLALSSMYSKLYKRPAEEISSSRRKDSSSQKDYASRSGSSAHERMTWGQLRLTEKDLQKRKENEEWQRKYNPDHDFWKS